MRIVVAAVAALALSTGAAHAQGKGNGNGNGNGSKPGQSANAGKGKGNGPDQARGKQSRSNGNAKAERSDRRVERGGGPAKVQRGNGNTERGNSRSAGNQGNSQARGQAQANRERREDAASRDTYRDQRTNVRYDDRRDRDVERSGDRYGYLVQDRNRSALDGCPPGLAKKRNGCNPPGLVRDRERTIFGYDYRPRYFGLNSYRDDRYRYNDGYLVRYGDGNRISGWIPLLGGALATGNVWPDRYQSYSLPEYYVDYYDLGGPDRYRYADNVVYRVDPGDTAIRSIAALLTGDRFVVGERMPRGYDVYNVPNRYRDRYYDTPEAMYRYSDGQIYRMDPTTRLVQAVIGLLV